MSHRRIATFRAAAFRRRLRDPLTPISKTWGVGSVEHLQGAALRRGARFAWVRVRGKHVEILVEGIDERRLGFFRQWVQTYRRHDQVVTVRRGSP